MPDLNQWLVDNLWIVVAVLLAGVIGLLAALVVLNRRLARATAAHRSLAEQAAGRSLADLLVAHGERVDAVDGRLAELDAEYRSLEARSRGSLQHLGIVRFNPFPDTGSDQSFAVALLNDRHSGVVITSLHGRGGTRIFAKSIEAGRASHTLSDEETQALGIAAEGAPPLDR